MSGFPGALLRDNGACDAWGGSAFLARTQGDRRAKLTTRSGGKRRKLEAVGSPAQSSCCLFTQSEMLEANPTGGRGPRVQDGETVGGGGQVALL